MNPFDTLPSSFESEEILEAAQAVIASCSKLSNYLQIRYNLTELQATYFASFLINSLPKELDKNFAIQPEITKIIKEIKETIDNG